MFRAIRLDFAVPPLIAQSNGNMVKTSAPPAIARKSRQRRSHQIRPGITLGQHPAGGDGLDTQRTLATRSLKHLRP